MRHVVLVIPPAVERAGKAWELMDPHAVIVCADHEQAVLWADAAPPALRAHAVTGVARTAALARISRPGGTTRRHAGAAVRHDLADVVELVDHAAGEHQGTWKN